MPKEDNSKLPDVCNGCDFQVRDRCAAIANDVTMYPRNTHDDSRQPKIDVNTPLELAKRVSDIEEVMLFQEFLYGILVELKKLESDHAIEEDAFADNTHGANRSEVIQDFQAKLREKTMRIATEKLTDFFQEFSTCEVTKPMIETLQKELKECRHSPNNFFNKLQSSIRSLGQNYKDLVYLKIAKCVKEEE